MFSTCCTGILSFVIVCMNLSISLLISIMSIKIPMELFPDEEVLPYNLQNGIVQGNVFYSSDTTAEIF